MRYLKPIAIALLIHLFALLAPFLVPIGLLFARWDSKPTLDQNGLHLAVRGDLPACFAWLNTPDERLPGGLYEPNVETIYQRYGRFLCSWYWLGLRNRGHGFAAQFGLPTSAYWPGEPGYYQRGGLWWLRYPLAGGRLQFKAGYRIYKLLDSSFLAVPVFTITKA
ncbi:hypothetical protein SAMN05216303_102278 [Rhodoferax sp. OV413]|nr:hypothetical protein SAMN05216303_102278 [Rhodoferax sp. OV413]